MKARLTDNVRPDRFKEAVALGKKIVNAVNCREDSIAALGVDPKFGFPDANWHHKAPNDFRRGYDLLATFDWDQVKYLRFRARNFTGFSLLHMKPDVGNCSEDIPADYDDRHSDECPDYLIDQWHVRVDGLPPEFIFRPRPMLGEVGWWVSSIPGRNVILNHDTVAYQERMSLLWRAGLFSIPKKILEVGGGYGGLAFAITSALPTVEYWICDLPESLLFSGMYLTMTTDLEVALWPERGSITLVPNYLFDQISDKFYLFINTLSLAEMTEYQVRIYLAGMKSLMASGGAFFEQNHLNNDLPDGTHQATVEQMCAETFPTGTKLQAPFGPMNGPAHVWSN